MEIPEFTTEVARIEISGMSALLASADQAILAYGPSVSRLVLVGDDAEELLSRATMTTVAERFLEQIQRRHLVAQGQWMIGTLPLDWPLWRDNVSSEIGDQVAATLDTLGERGHVAVFMLVDTATMTDAMTESE